MLLLGPGIRGLQQSFTGLKLAHYISNKVKDRTPSTALPLGVLPLTMLSL